MSQEMILIILVLISGFYMAWSIGANDVANAMGTSVGSGALTLRKAIFVAAILEFCGAYFFGSHVSETVQNGLIDTSIYSETPLKLVYGMLSALIATGVWLQIASYYGWPVSTTHTIVGAIVGFGLISGGLDAIQWYNIVFVASSWLISPLCGGIVSFFIFNLLRKQIFYSATPLQSAIKLTPPLVLVVITTLSLVMVYQGLQNLHLDLNLFEAFGISIALGGIASGASMLWLKKLPLTPNKTAREALSLPQAMYNLEKAKEHLKSDETPTKFLEEMESISDALKKSEERLDKSSEYAIVERIFGYMQVMSACLMAFAHGANDVANAIGPLSAALQVLLTGQIFSQAPVPAWTLALGGLGIVVGLATWGWRVIETIGKKITELTPTRGFAAEFGAAATVLVASRLGMPISTTHTLVGSVIGVGLARGIEALDLRMTRDILLSWIVTVPAGALLTIALYFGIQTAFG